MISKLESLKKKKGSINIKYWKAYLFGSYLPFKMYQNLFKNHFAIIAN